MKIRKKIVQNINGLNYFFLESGNLNAEKSNAIFFLHGFPELSYSYRHLLKNFAEEGYYCIAPDQRGYGRTSQRKNSKDLVSNYSIFNLTKDIFFLLCRLRLKKINLVGHDFGSYVVGYFCLLYPTYVKSIVIMSMPFGGAVQKKTSFNIKKIDNELRSLKDPKKHYQVYLSGKTANTNMINCKQGVFKFLRAYYHFKSYDYKDNKPHKLKNNSIKELCKMPEYYIMKKKNGMAQTVKYFMPTQEQIEKCIWMSNIDLAIYSKSFKKKSFQGPLNWYKMMLNANEIKKIQMLKLPIYTNIPAIFIAGKSDWGPYQKPGQLDSMRKFFKNFYGTFFISKAGHWVQQEQSKKTFDVIKNFYSRIF